MKCGFLNILFEQKDFSQKWYAQLNLLFKKDTSFINSTSFFNHSRDIWQNMLHTLDSLRVVFIPLTSTIADRKKGKIRVKYSLTTFHQNFHSHTSPWESWRNTLNIHQLVVLSSQETSIIVTKQWSSLYSETRLAQFSRSSYLQFNLNLNLL